MTKKARLLTQHEVELTTGSHNDLRAVADLNQRLGDSSALRLGAMQTTADSNGSGTRLDKAGVAVNLRRGAGTDNEFDLTAYHLDNNNGMNYGMPWIRPTTSAPVSATTLLPLSPIAYCGMASDRNHGTASILNLAHTHRFANRSELVTKVQRGRYERDQWSGANRFDGASMQPGGQAASLATFGPNTVINRGTHLKMQDMDTLFARSGFSGRFRAWGMTHAVQAGVDLSRESKVVYAARSAAQGGVNLGKPTTRVGTPDDGAWIDESQRVLRVISAYRSQGEGLYLQDVIEVASR